MRKGMMCILSSLRANDDKILCHMWCMCIFDIAIIDLIVTQMSHQSISIMFLHSPTHPDTPHCHICHSLLTITSTAHPSLPYLLQIYGRPTIVINYPKGIKAFYMKLNDDNETVAAMDILVPKIGELIGGSQRYLLHHSYHPLPPVLPSPTLSCPSLPPTLS